jgi:hypothetical protein
VKQLWIVGLLLIATPAVADRKPAAPVTVTLEQAPAPGGYRVTLVAVPTRAVPSLALSLSGTRVELGPTAAGQRRELSVVVQVATGTGADVVGSATAFGRKKAAVTRVGTARVHAVKRAVRRTLPDGTSVSEAR